MTAESTIAPTPGWDWALGVTTAPRRRPTLTRCLRSLRAAGWKCPHLFAEPGIDLGAEFSDLPVSQHAENLGAFPNWYAALTELLMLKPDADAYALVQDDCEIAVGLRCYLERTLWPAPDPGVVSVYRPSHYPEAARDGYWPEDRGWHSWGALFYVFPNPSAKRIASDPMVLNHRFAGPNNGVRNIDSVVGQWCRERGLRYFVHSPSLVQHTGDTSTIWRSGNRGPRRAGRFVDDVRLLSTAEDTWTSEALHPVSDKLAGPVLGLRL